MLPLFLLLTSTFLGYYLLKCFPCILYIVIHAFPDCTFCSLWKRREEWFFGLWSDQELLVIVKMMGNVED
jgi:hypothetical protein